MVKTKIAKYETDGWEARLPEALKTAPPGRHHVAIRSSAAPLRVSGQGLAKVSRSR